jgi:hypothetical protein
VGCKELNAFYERVGFSIAAKRDRDRIGKLGLLAIRRNVHARRRMVPECHTNVAAVAGVASL